MRVGEWKQYLGFSDPAMTRSYYREFDLERGTLSDCYSLKDWVDGPNVLKPKERTESPVTQ